MILSHNQIIEAITGEGIIEYPEGFPFNADCVNAASLDLHLGNTILYEAKKATGLSEIGRVSLADRTALNLTEWNLHAHGPFNLYPGEFILAQSVEIFHLPNWLSAEYKLKSSMARIGLEHLNAGWCDAGWNGSVLTLELKNMTRGHVIRLDAGVRIGQIVFFKHDPVPASASYATKGRYNGDKKVQGVKS